MTVSLELVSIPESIAQVETLLQRIAQTVPIGTDTYYSIQIALTEAVNNAILHGNKSDRTKIVTINAHYTSESVVFEVTDEGKGFDANTIPDPTKGDNLLKPGGRGVFLMRELCDKLYYIDKGRTARLYFIAD